MVGFVIVVILVVALASEYQPTPYFSYITVVPGVVALSLSSVILYILGLHFAYKVILLVVVLGEYVAPELCAIAPVSVVAYPHVCPVYVIVGSVTLTAVQLAVNVIVPASVLKFLKYAAVTLVEALLHAVFTAVLLVPYFAVDVEPLE